MDEYVILLVEDSDEDFAVIARALKQTSVTVTLRRCARGEEALDFLHRRGVYNSAPRPALALLDLNLPGLSGIEVLQRIRQDERLKSLPVIVLTTSSNPRDVSACYQAGANAYQVKVVDYPAFKGVLRRLISYWLTDCLIPSGPEETKEK